MCGDTGVWGTGPLPKLVSLLEARGVRVFELLQDEDVAEFRACAASVWFPGASWPEMPVIVVNGALSGEQKRFALCHELAHMIFPSLFRHVLPIEVREESANWFAGALLLPPLLCGISSAESGGHYPGTSSGKFKGSSGLEVTGLRVGAGKRGSSRGIRTGSFSTSIAGANGMSRRVRRSRRRA